MIMMQVNLKLGAYSTQVCIVPGGILYYTGNGPYLHDLLTVTDNNEKNPKFFIEIYHITMPYILPEKCHHLSFRLLTFSKTHPSAEARKISTLWITASTDVLIWKIALKAHNQCNTGSA